ncbi:MAG: hypothetical protein JJ894_07820 [Dinoroseobacter sp.]|nr:hypothetical protein [Dinoroseobacter sp.]
MGITPFLAWAEALPKEDAACHLVYCFCTQNQAAHLERIEALVTANPSLQLHVVDSSQAPRLTADGLAELVGEDVLAEATVAYCGPAVLREGLRLGLRTYGVTARRFHFEAFEFRTGIDLKALAEWVLTRALRKAQSVSRQKRTA